MLYESVRQEALKTTVELYRKGLLHLTSGNVSARASAEHAAVTPSGVACEGMRPEDIHRGPGWPRSGWSLQAIV